MSNIARLAWPIQIATFLLLLFLLPHGALRVVILFAYIVVSIIVVGYIRRRNK